MTGQCRDVGSLGHAELSPVCVGDRFVFWRVPDSDLLGLCRQQHTTAVVGGRPAPTRSACNCWIPFLLGFVDGADNIRLLGRQGPGAHVQGRVERYADLRGDVVGAWYRVSGLRSRVVGERMRRPGIIRPLVLCRLAKLLRPDQGCVGLGIQHLARTVPAVAGAMDHHGTSLGI